MKKVPWQFEPLVESKIRSAMQSDQLRLLSKLEIFENIGSTNSYLLTQASDSTVSGAVCFAEEQTEGRGRRGRSWFSPRGSNLYCSLVWDFTGQDVSALSLVVGVILVQALRRYGVRREIQLKWPNDIVFCGQKLGGVLLEKSGSCVVIGFGLNVCLPDDLAQELVGNVVDLASLVSSKIKRNELAGLILDELFKQLTYFTRAGVVDFLRNWRRYDALFGKKITVQTPQQIVVGVMQGVNDKGELLLLDDNGDTLVFCYGEVTVRAI